MPSTRRHTLVIYPCRTLMSDHTCVVDLVAVDFLHAWAVYSTTNWTHRRRRKRREYCLEHHASNVARDGSSKINDVEVVCTASQVPRRGVSSRFPSCDYSLRGSTSMEPLSAYAPRSPLSAPRPIGPQRLLCIVAYRLEHKMSTSVTQILPAT
ncbi:hypothetical protein BDW22DRAFT_1101459 [Trametopsis cervina]|nr:hypothetical protein BDW22DRAFT_1101459 [Trametopsis cervina]